MRRVAVALLEATAVGTVVLLQSSGAMASAFALRENSAAGMGTAFAGAASAADDLSTIFNNPAGMTKLTGSQAEAVTTLIYPSIHFQGDGASAAGPDGGDAGGANMVPALYGMYDISPDWRAGLAITTPFGLKTRYNSDWVGRYAGINTALLALDVNPNIAYKATDWLSVGGGFSAQYLRVDEDHALNMAALTGVPGVSDGRARVKADSVGWGYNFGFLLEPLQGTRVGLTYRSRIEHTLEGHVLFGVPTPFEGVPAFQNSAATGDLTLPDSATLSLTQAITPRLSLSTDLQWTHWSTFDTVRVATTGGTPVDSTHFGFKDTIFASVGAVYKLTDNWTLRGGAGFDQSPVRNEFRTVRLPDNDRFLLSFGVSYEFNDAFRVDAGYLHLFINDAGITGSENAVAPLTGETIAGQFSLKADQVSIAARLRF